MNAIKIARFDDGDIRGYRKFFDWCPSYLYTERYNHLKQKAHYDLQLSVKRFYSVSYHQPSGNIHQESYCSTNGTLCNVTSYVYDKSGVFRRKEFSQTNPCIELQLEGKNRSVKLGNLDVR
jgi:hypothetical protein